MRDLLFVDEQSRSTAERCSFVRNTGLLRNGIPGFESLVLLVIEMAVSFPGFQPGGLAVRPGERSLPCGGPCFERMQVYSRSIGQPKACSSSTAFPARNRRD